MISKTVGSVKVGGFTAACVLVSNVVGGGIFTTTGFLARDMGDARFILVLWILGAGLALAGAMCYAELGASMPEIGGDFTYLRQAYGPLVGFLSGWASFTVGFAAAVAAAAVSFASYLLQIGPVTSLSPIVVKVIALSLVWTLTGVHLLGTGAGGSIQRILTVTKIGTIVAVLVSAVLFGSGKWEYLSEVNPLSTPTLGKAAVGLVFVMYAYSGWNVAGYIAGEILDPARTLPRIMIGGTLFVGVLYVALNLVYFYALPVSALAEEPILPVVEKTAMALFGPTGANAIGGMLCVSIAAAVSAMIWAGPRVYYAMAQNQLLPAFLAEVREGGAPMGAIVLQGVWTSILIISGSFEQLIIYSGLVLTAFSAVTASAVLVLRRRQPALPRPYRVPLSAVTPGIYIGVSQRPMESVLAAGTVLAGVPVYLAQKRRSGSR